MKLTERLALIKAGYNKKEIAAIEAEATAAIEEENEASEDPKEPEQEPAQDSEPETETETSDQNEIEELRQMIANLQQTISQIQQNNVNEDQSDNLPGEQSIDDLITEIVY